MPTRAVGRHRATAPAKTPLSVLVSVVSTNASTVTRRSAVVAASSGLVVSMGLPAATAAPVAESTAPEPTTTPAAEPKVEAEVNPVSVPADAAVSFARTALTAVTPPPPPPPPPAVEASEPEERTTARASRTTQRAATTTEKAPAVQAAPSEAAGSVLAVAARYVGVMYRSGGTTPGGFDCSGYVQYVYAQLGINLPRTSGAQAAAGRRVSASEARPGDIVWTSGHVGIYAGGNMMYDSPRTGKAVSKRAIWFTPNFTRVTG